MWLTDKVSGRSDIAVPLMPGDRSHPDSTATAYVREIRRPNRHHETSTGLSGNEFDRQASVSTDDVVDGPCGRAREFDTVDALHKRPKHRGSLKPGQTLSSAGVGSVAETELTGGVALDVEAVGVIPLKLVTIRRRIDDQHAGSNWNHVSGDLSRLADLTGERPQRRFVTENLVDGVRDSRRILLEDLPLLGVGGEEVQSMRDGADGGVQRWCDAVSYTHLTLPTIYSV